MTHSRAWRQIKTLMIASDAVTVVLAYILADLVRCLLWEHTAWPEPLPGDVDTVRIHLKILIFLPILWPAILNGSGWYAQKWRPIQWVIRTAATSSTILALAMAALALLLERELYPRAQIALASALIFATTLAGRGITGWIGRWFGGRRRNRVLIIGTSRDAVRIRRLLRQAAQSRASIVGHLQGPWEDGETSSRVSANAILGGIDRLGPILDSGGVDEVVFSAPLDHVTETLPWVRLCEEVGVTAHIQAESMACHSIPEIVNFHGVPLLAYAPARHAPELLAVKRAFDILLGIVGIAITGPIMLICAILIKLTTPGPILFRQRRSGLNGREFLMFKFRTMEPDAERKQANLAHLNESSGPVFKIKHDPRVTWVGRFLRRWSLDELPQLFNVVRGDMAIVGPRPPIPAEVVKYDRWQRRRLSMRPGLTCIWQIKGRHRIGFQEWMHLDLFYIDHWSLRLDFLILCRTISTVLSGSGA